MIRSRLIDSDVYYGWVVTAACFLVVLSVYSVNLSFSVFFDHLLADLHQSRARTSLVFSVQTMTLYVSAALLGGVVDRYPTRRVLLLGTALLTGGLAAASRADSIATLMVSYGLVAGVGLGIVYVVGYSTVPRWFHRRRGVATAIATSGLGMATLVIPHTASVLIRTLGWQTAYLVIMAGGFAALLAAAALIADDPVTLGVDPSGEFPERATLATERGTWRTQFAEVTAVVRSGSFLSVFVHLVLVYTSLYVVLVHGVVYATDVGMGRAAGVWAISLVGASAIPGRILLGHVSDRFDRLSVYIALAVAMGVLVMSLAAVETALAFYGFAVVYGFVYGGGAGLMPSLVADLFGVKNISAFWGTAALGLGVAAVLGPYLGGLTFETFGSYDPIFLVSGGLAVIGAVLAATWFRVRADQAV